jgi:O-antigen/teichoic acid export membrane protein
MVAGQAVYAASQWGILVVLAQFGGPEQVGRFALALAVTAPLVIFSQLQLSQILVADARRKYPFADYLAIRVVATAAAGLIVILVVAIGGDAPEAAAVILAVGLAKCIESLNEILHGLEHRWQRLDLAAKSTMMCGTFGFAALTLAFLLTGQLFVAVLAMAAVWAAVWLLFDRWVTAPWRAADAREPGEELRDRPWRRRLRLAWTGVPLAVALTLGSLNTNAPRYFVEGSLGTAALGVFAAMTYFFVAGQMVVHSLCKAAAPRLADHFARGEIVAFRWLFLRLMLIGAACGAVGLLVAAVLGNEILALLYGRAFAAHAEVFVWIMLVGVVAYTFARWATP